MNPETNKFEKLMEDADSALLDEIQKKTSLLRPNGEPVPKHWSVFRDGEHVVVKNYTFKVVHIGEQYMVLEPVGPVVVGEE